MTAILLLALTATGWAAVKGEADLEWQMLDLVNQERAKVGAPPLKMDQKLVEVARIKSQDMIDNNYFAHTSPTYGDPFQMMRSFGIDYIRAGENLAGNPSLTGAHTALMNSPGHRANILNAEYTHMGIGVVKGGRYGMMITQLFIRTRDGAATPAERPQPQPVQPAPSQPAPQPEPTPAQPTPQPKPEPAPQQPKEPVQQQGSKEVDVFYKNRKVSFPDIKPFINDQNRVMIPIRFLSENMGYKVDWHGPQQKIEIQNGTRRIDLTINNNLVRVNNFLLRSDSSPMLVNNRTDRKSVV